MPGSAGKALFLQLVHSGTGEGNSLSVDGGAVADPRNSRPGRAVPTDNLVRSVWLQSDQVHAAWTATHPGNRHPGANACQAAFDQVRTGTGVTVQPAVAMDTADGGHIAEPMHPAARSPTGTTPWNPTISSRPW